MNFDKVLFRASSIGKLMTDPRSKSELLSETTKTALIDVYGDIVHSRREEISSKYIEKGNAVENEGIDIWRRKRNVVVFKNTERLNNEYVTGLPDIQPVMLDGKLTVPDIKSSWSWNTYAESVMKPLNKVYEGQGQIYMWLTGADMAVFIFVLVNAPIELINDEKYRLSRKLNLIDPQGNPTYIEKCKQIERNMIFDMGKFMDEYPGANLESDLSEWSFDIPLSKRVNEKFIERDENYIENVKSRVPLWRAELRNIDSKF